MPKTVSSCLSCINVTASALASCANVQDEFSVIKKCYFRAILKNHPDKGGDVIAFRQAQAAFEVLRGLFESGRVSAFSDSLDMDTEAGYGDSMNGFQSRSVPSWDFYAAAAEEVVPTYRVELAKSNRSSCCQTGNAKHCLDESIAKGEVRIGSIDSDAGCYGRWVHLKCWRVPSKVWLGLPDPDKCTDAKRFEAALVSMSAVLICGIGELPPAERRAVAHFTMNKENWARLTKRTDPKAVAALLAGGGGASATAGGAMTATGAVGASSSSSLVARAAQREKFVIPAPGRNGAKPGSLAGKTFCMTGTFPELGGGTGLALGKERTQAMIESFGGRVTTCLSGRTDILVVGKEPGRVKVGEAQNTNVRLMGLDELKQGLERGRLLPASEAPELVITEFSAGYRGNGGGGNYLQDHHRGRFGGGVHSLDHKKAATAQLAQIKVRKAAKAAAEAAAAGGAACANAGARGPPSRPAAPHAAATPTPRPAPPKPAPPSAPTPAPKPASTVTPAPRPAPKPAEAKPPASKEPAFTFAPLESINVTALKASRFLIEGTRSLPYRDEKGTVSLHLLRRSSQQVQDGSVVPPAEVAAKLAKWLKHAERAFAEAGQGGALKRAAEEDLEATAEKKRRREVAA